MCVRPMKQFREFEKRMCGLCSSSVFLVALFTLLTTLVFATPQSSSPAPDAIFIGQFLTLDPGHPRAEAIAVSAGRIVAVGSKAEVEALAMEDNVVEWVLGQVGVVDEKMSFDDLMGTSRYYMKNTAMAIWSSVRHR